MMIITMAVFTGEYITIISIIYTLLLIAIDLMLNKVKNRKNKNVKGDKQIARQLCIGTYLGAANLITVVFVLLYMNFLNV